MDINLFSFFFSSISEKVYAFTCLKNTCHFLKAVEIFTIQFIENFYPNKVEWCVGKSEWRMAANLVFKAQTQTQKRATREKTRERDCTFTCG
jgi:predicted metalloprotease with PDZ domain